MPTIQVLPRQVVDQIAAGEVVQRAASAIKELLENALDAGATEITVTVTSPTEFSVVDNGCGIPVDDLPLACTRHATSKLRDASDLKTIESFGFRGEALAALSMVSTVQIITKTANSKVGFAQTYKNGNPTNKSATPRARPSIGTTIRVTNLFAQTMAHRKKSQRMSTEYALIFKAVESYALHYPKVDFVCTKAGQPMDLCSRGASDSFTVTSILVGKPKAWTEHECELLEKDDSGEQIFSAKVWMADLHDCPRKSKQPFLLFVNDRLVSNRAIQTALENVLESTSHLIHVDLQVPPYSVDVNVHPTKQTVVLFHLDLISKHLADSLRQQLQHEQTIRTTSSSSQPTQNSHSKKRKEQPTQDSVDSDIDARTVSEEKTRPEPLSSQQPKVRINSSTGALTPFFAPAKVHDPSCPAFDMSQPGAFVCTCQDIHLPPSLGMKKFDPISPTPCNYTSIKKLRKTIQQRNCKHPLKRAAYIGPFSSDKSLLQYGPDLILWSHRAAAVELFSQCALWRFKGGAGVADVGPIAVSECIAAVAADDSAAEQATSSLLQRSDMLLEYFSIRIDRTTGCLTGLPVLLADHMPSPAHVPVFLFRLSTKVDYSDELQCFQGVCNELGEFYGRSCIMPDFFPALRSLLVASNDMEWIKITDLKECYRVFER